MESDTAVIIYLLQQKLFFKYKILANATAHASMLSDHHVDSVTF